MPRSLFGDPPAALGYAVTNGVRPLHYLQEYAQPTQINRYHRWSPAIPSLGWFQVFLLRMQLLDQVRSNHHELTLEHFGQSIEWLQDHIECPLYLKWYSYDWLFEFALPL